MQYILTQEELDSLSPKYKYEEMRDKAMELSKRLSFATNFRCVALLSGIYCSGCPADDCCPYERKHYAK